MNGCEWEGNGQALVLVQDPEEEGGNSYGRGRKRKRMKGVTMGWGRTPVYRCCRPRNVNDLNRITHLPTSRQTMAIHSIVFCLSVTAIIIDSIIHESLKYSLRLFTHIFKTFDVRVGK